MKIKIMSRVLMFFLSFGLTACLDSDGDLEGVSTDSNVTISTNQILAGSLPSDVLIGSVAQLPSPINGSSCSAS